jgi:hypothetical protein
LILQLEDRAHGTVGDNAPCLEVERACNFSLRQMPVPAPSVSPTSKVGAFARTWIVVVAFLYHLSTIDRGTLTQMSSPLLFSESTFQRP